MALQPLGYVGQPVGNYNTDIGLPLAILRTRSGQRSVLAWLGVLLRGLELLITRRLYPDILVLELGSDAPGDAAVLLGIVQPRVGIVTAISAVHLEQLKDLAGVAAEEGTLIRRLPHDGWAILNRDDEQVWSMRQHTVASVKSYGFHQSADVRVADWRCVNHENNLGTLVKIEANGSTVPVFIPGALGKQYAYVCAAATATALSLGLNLLDVGAALADFIPAAGRMRALDGLNDSLLIDDTYNSSPLACTAALETLQQLFQANLCQRQVVVFGDMLELGSTSPKLHAEVGEYVVACGVNVLVTVGDLAAHISTATQLKNPEMNIHSFANKEEAVEFLQHAIRPGDAVLIKGSQSSRMEKVTKALLSQPSRSAELLVRQTAYWLAR
jgi:UDP-N-acetylmuramoyl-tripeptide--D-alanyl-D-alanine ligase